MIKNTQSIEKLIQKFCSLGGVGRKTAMRYAYKIVDMDRANVEEFCDILLEVKDRVRYCRVCATFAESDVCDICSRRKSDTICVVSYPKDVLSIERTGGYEGLYHVLHGTISPMDGRGPDDLRIKQLFDRLDNIKEIIIATNSDTSGEATAIYIARLLLSMGIKVSRIAQGMSMGSEIEFVDESTLSRAIGNRVEYHH